MHQPLLRLPRSGLWALSGVEVVFARGFASKSLEVTVPEMGKMVVRGLKNPFHSAGFSS
jgi:hypothetical protein